MLYVCYISKLGKINKSSLYKRKKMSNKIQCQIIECFLFFVCVWGEKKKPLSLRDIVGFSDEMMLCLGFALK